MTHGARYKSQRGNRVRLKADCVELFDRLLRASNLTDAQRAAIAPIRARLLPGGARCPKGKPTDHG